MNQTEFLSQLRQALNRYGLDDIEDILADFREHFSAGLAKGKDEHEIALELGDPEEIATQYAGEQPHAFKGAAGTSGTGRTDGFVYVEDSRGNPRMPAGARPAAPGGTPSGSAAGYTHSDAGPTGSTHSDAGPTGYTRSDASSAGHTRGNAAPVMVEHTETNGLNVVLLILLAVFVAMPIFFTCLGILIGIWAAGFGVGAGSAALFTVALTEAGMAAVVLLLFGVALAALTILLFITAWWLSRLFARALGAYVRWNRRIAKGGAAA